MCELCTEDKEIVRAGLEMRAQQLQRMAGYMREMANGRIKPHTKEAREQVAPLAHLLTRFLVEDWL